MPLPPRRSSRSSPRRSPQSFGVIGAGIIGLATARELTQRFPGAAVTVLEKEDRVAAHQSGRNSGVVHAGLYYQPGSLKAVLCRRGSAMLREYCAHHGISHLEVGKLVVALSDTELPGLQRIEERARANGVPDLARLDAAGLREVEPGVAGRQAVHSPHTAVVDFAAVCASLADDVRAAGGQVLLGTSVRAARLRAGRVQMVAGESSQEFDRLIVCAGLGTDRVAALLGAVSETRIVPFRGEYYRLASPAAQRVRGLVYPVPDPRYPFLGVHLTRTIGGDVLAGPNAVLALALEGYRWSDVSARDLLALAQFAGARRMASKHWRTGLRELTTSLSRRAFAQRARRYLPSLSASDLLPAPAGVRAQAIGRDGALLDDFVIQEVGPVLLVRNAPSPAATSSLAIAEHLVTRASS